jgi:hypothetical protein
VRVVLETLHQLLDVLVEHRMEGDLAGPVVELAGRRQLAEEDEVRGLEERAVLGQLLDWVAAVEQDALVAVDVGDAAAARGGVLKRRVVGHQAEIFGVRLDLPQVHRADRAVLDAQFVLLAGAVVGNRERIGHPWYSSALPGGSSVVRDSGVSEAAGPAIR